MDTFQIDSINILHIFKYDRHSEQNIYLFFGVFCNSINSKLSGDYTSLYSSYNIQLTTEVTAQTKERKQTGQTWGH